MLRQAPGMAATIFAETMSWTDHFPVLEASADISPHGPTNAWSTEVFSVDQSYVDSGKGHIVSTGASWLSLSRPQDSFPNVPRVMELLSGRTFGPLSRVEKWLVYLGQAVRGLQRRQEPVGMRVYLAPELKDWAQAIAEAGGEAVVMAGNSFLESTNLWRLLALEESRLVTLVGPHRIREAVQMADLTERMKLAALCFWREPGYGTARTRDMTDYRPVLGAGMGSTGGLPIRRLLCDLDAAMSAGRIRPECRMPDGRTRRLAGAEWPQPGFDEWFLLAAVYPRVAQGGILTVVEGQRLSPTLLALDIEYVTWANPAATVIAPRMGADWPVARAGGRTAAMAQESPLLRVTDCPEIPTTGLTMRHPLPEHAWRDEGMARTMVDPHVVSHFNPASIRWRGHQWLAYRTECQPMWKWGRVSLARVNQKFRAIEGTNRLLTLPTSFDEWCAEDPRLFVHQDRLFLTYTDHWTTGVAEILEDGSVTDARIFPFDTEATRNLRSRHDKNWGFFEANGRLYAVYWTLPHVVREVDLNLGQFGREWRRDWHLPPGLSMELHGGSGPVEHKGLMWRVVHHHSNDGLAANERRYSLWLMAFESVPPFSPRWFCDRPLLRGERMQEEPLAGWRDWMVVFCSSLERIPGGWRYCFGHNDRRMRWGQLSDSNIEPHLLGVGQAAPDL